MNKYAMTLSESLKVQLCLDQKINKHEYNSIKLLRFPLPFSHFPLTLNLGHTVYYFVFKETLQIYSIILMILTVTTRKSTLSLFERMTCMIGARAC